MFVPHCAMSGGTLIALACDRVVLDPDAVLGPVDPQLGPFAAASILAAVAQKPAAVSDETLIVVVCEMVAGNPLVENVLEPTLTGRALDLSPTVVFVSFFVWTWLLGPAGMLMSMPITVLLMLALDGDERTRWAARLIGRRAPTAPAGAMPAGAEQRPAGVTVDREPSKSDGDRQ